MDQAEIDDRLSAGSGYTDLPGRHVTMNQIVAYNLAYWRKAAGMTQDELGQALRWSKAAVSAAERSWDGKRIRQFDADLLMALATILRVPISAFFLPPEDDGVKERYLYHVVEQGDYNDCHIMYDLMTYIPSDPTDDDTPVMNRYAQRLATTANFYFGEGRGPDSSSESITTEEEVVARLERSRAQYEAMRGIISDIDRYQEDMITLLHKIRANRRQEGTAPPPGLHRVSPNETSMAARMETGKQEQ
jgi:transcriptional regulator with XRE-family HTH domain